METDMTDRNLWRARRTVRVVLLVLLVSGSAKGLWAQDRLPPIPIDKLTEEQKKAVGEVSAQNNGTLPAYLNPFVRSPELMKRVASLGDYVVRGKTALNRKQTELVILLIVRDWSQKYMWSSHQSAALRAGLSADTVTAIGEGSRPDHLASDEAALYDFCTELLEHRGVSDVTFARMSQAFGDAGILDTIGLAGYYVVLSMTYNASRMPPTPGGAALPQLIQ
jgi:4-carboxymuconolactone decarboxylase